MKSPIGSVSIDQLLRRVHSPTHSGSPQPKTYANLGRSPDHARKMLIADCIRRRSTTRSATGQTRNPLLDAAAHFGILATTFCVGRRLVNYCTKVQYALLAPMESSERQKRA
jgi:hypothetical protein